MNTRKELLTYGLSFDNTYVDEPFHDGNWDLVRFKPNKKFFMAVYDHNGQLCINIKVTPGWRDFFRNIYPAVIPAYHMNHEHWNTVIIDGSVPEDDLKRMIAESYDMISDSPTKRIYEAVKKIPAGHVATYKTIAALAGDPKMCRAVGNALHKNPDPVNIPCFRVVNAKGELSGAFAFGGAGVQQRMLEADGVVVQDGRVDLEQFGWMPI